MPAGVAWSTYLKFTTSALLAMLAGAQVVHLYYRPLEDIDVFIQKELENENPPKQS